MPWPGTPRSELFTEYLRPMQPPIRVPTALGLLAFAGISGILMAITIGLCYFIAYYLVLTFPIGMVLNWVIVGWFGLRIGALRGGIGGAVLCGFLCVGLGFGLVLLIDTLVEWSIFNAWMGLGLASFIGPLIIGAAFRLYALDLLDRPFVPMPVPLPPPAAWKPVDPSKVQSPYPVPPEAQQFWAGEDAKRRGRPPPPVRRQR